MKAELITLLFLSCCLVSWSSEVSTSEQSRRKRGIFGQDENEYEEETEYYDEYISTEGNDVKRRNKKVHHQSKTYSEKNKKKEKGHRRPESYDGEDDYDTYNEEETSTTSEEMKDPNEEGYNDYDNEDDGDENHKGESKTKTRGPEDYEETEDASTELIYRHTTEDPRNDYEENYEETIPNEIDITTSTEDSIEEYEEFSTSDRDISYDTESYSDIWSKRTTTKRSQKGKGHSQPPHGEDVEDYDDDYDINYKEFLLRVKSKGKSYTAIIVYEDVVLTDKKVKRNSQKTVICPLEGDCDKPTSVKFFLEGSHDDHLFIQATRRIAGEGWNSSHQVGRMKRHANCYTVGFNHDPDEIELHIYKIIGFYEYQYVEGVVCDDKLVGALFSDKIFGLQIAPIASLVTEAKQMRTNEPPKESRFQKAWSARKKMASTTTHNFPSLVVFICLCIIFTLIIDVSGL